MNKYIENGFVAVVYSPGHGAGWSTWNSLQKHCEELIFDPGLVDLIINERPWEEIEAYATLKWPDAYLGGVSEAIVEWIPVGTEFAIEDYDGRETIKYRNDGEWITA